MKKQLLQTEQCRLGTPIRVGGQCGRAHMELETTIHSGGTWTVVSFTLIASAVQMKVGDKCLVLSRGGVLSDSCYRW